MKLYDVVADVDIDLSELTVIARRRGLALRRRRQALASFGAVVAIAAVTTGGLALQRGADDRMMPSDSTSNVPPTSAVTYPNTGRATVASLEAAVATVKQGTFTHAFGQGPADGVTGDSYGQADFYSADGHSGQVQVNVQSLSILDGEQLPYACLSFMSDCTIRHLADGDTLRLYTDRSSKAHSTLTVAELLSPARHLRVVGGVLDGFNLSDGFRSTGAAPLSQRQLAQVVTQPWWGFRLPYDGSQLSSYREPSSVGIAPSAPSTTSEPRP